MLHDRGHQRRFGDGGGLCDLGFSALYYKLLADIPPLEVLAHRTLWSVFVFIGVLALQSRLGELRRALSGGRSFLLIGAGALMISTNWFFFIFPSKQAI